MTVCFEKICNINIADIVFQFFLWFDVAVGADGRPVLVGEGGELQAVEGEHALTHVLLGVVAASALTEN